MWVSARHWSVMAGLIAVTTSVAAVPVPSAAVVGWRSLVVLGTSLLTSEGWSALTIWWWPSVTPSRQLTRALLFGELGLDVVLEL